MSRAALLLLALVALVAFATSRAVREVERSGLQTRFVDAVTLARATGDNETRLWVQAASPARRFFLLSALVTEPIAFDNTSPTVGDWNLAAYVLTRHDEARFPQLDVDEHASALSPCVRFHPGDIAAAIKARCEAMNALARQLANDVEKSYDAAFSVSIGAAGAQVPLDLRNWLAVVPLALLVAACYFYLLTYERRLVGFVGRELVRNTPDAPVVDRLTYRTHGGAPLHAYAGQLLTLLFVLVLLVQLRFLVVSWTSLLNGDDWWPAASLAGAILVGWAVQACRILSERMVSVVEAETGLTPPRSAIVRVRDHVLRRWRDVLSTYPRRMLGFSAPLLLLTLLLPTATTSCGPVPGYTLVISPMTPEQIVQSKGDQETVWWLPSMMLSEPTPESEDAPLLEDIVLVADQEMGYTAYVLLLACAASSVIWLLWSAVRPGRASPLAMHVMSRIAFITATFTVAEFAWAFTGPHVRLILLGVVLPLTIVALWPGSATAWRAKLRHVVAPVMFPVFAAAPIVWGAFAVAEGIYKIWDTESEEVSIAFAGFAVLVVAAPILAQSLMALAAASRRVRSSDGAERQALSSPEAA